jgi:hypothetical protein
MSVQDWHAYAARVTEQHQHRQQAEQSGPVDGPIQDLSSFGLVPAADQADQAEADLAPEPEPVAAPAPQPAAPLAPVVQLSPVEVAPIAAPEAVAPVASAAPEATEAVAPVLELPAVDAVDAAPIVLAAAEVAPIVLAAAEAAPVVALASVVEFARPTARPSAVDVDLRPVMADRLAGDLADLTRVLLGVASSAAPTVAPMGAPTVAAAGRSTAVPPPVVSPEPTVSFTPLSFEPVAEVAPLVPVPPVQEPPTPVAPTPTVAVDVVLSELSFLDG